MLKIHVNNLIYPVGQSDAFNLPDQLIRCAVMSVKDSGKGSAVAKAVIGGGGGGGAFIYSCYTRLISFEII